MVRGGPEVRFHEGGFHVGSTRVPPGVHEGSTRVPQGSASTACCWGYHLSFFCFLGGGPNFETNSYLVPARLSQTYLSLGSQLPTSVRALLSNVDPLHLSSPLEDVTKIPPSTPPPLPLESTWDFGRGQKPLPRPGLDSKRLAMSSSREVRIRVTTRFVLYSISVRTPSQPKKKR